MLSNLIAATGLGLTVYRRYKYYDTNITNRNTSIMSLELLLTDIKSKNDKIDFASYNKDEIKYLLSIDAIYHVENNDYKINPYVHLYATTKPILVPDVELIPHPTRKDVTYGLPSENRLAPEFLIRHYEELVKLYKNESLTGFRVPGFISAGFALYLGYGLATGGTSLPINFLLTLAGAYCASDLRNYNPARDLIPPAYTTALLLPTYLSSPNNSSDDPAPHSSAPLKSPVV